MCRSIPPCAGLISTPPARGKGGRSETSAGWGGHRAQRPRPRPVTGRAEHETASGLRARPASVVDAGHCRRPGTVRSSARSWPVSGYLGTVQAGPGPAQIGSWLIRPTALAATVLNCADAVSGRPSASLAIRSAIGSGVVRPVAGRQPSTARSTSSVTPWTAASTDSNDTEPLRPDTTNSPSATLPPSASLLSASGSDDFPNTPLAARNVQLAAGERPASGAPRDRGGHVCAPGRPHPPSVHLLLTILACQTDGLSHRARTAVGRATRMVRRPNLSVDVLAIAAAGLWLLAFG